MEWTFSVSFMVLFQHFFSRLLSQLYWSIKFMDATVQIASFMFDRLENLHGRFVYFFDEISNRHMLTV